MPAGPGAPFLQCLGPYAIRASGKRSARHRATLRKSRCLVFKLPDMIPAMAGQSYHHVPQVYLKGLFDSKKVCSRSLAGAAATPKRRLPSKCVCR